MNDKPLNPRFLPPNPLIGGLRKEMEVKVPPWGDLGGGDIRSKYAAIFKTHRLSFI
jgi:hypothetical protein